MLLAALIIGCQGAPSAAQAYAAAADTSNAVLDSAPNQTTGTLDEWHAWGTRVIAANQAFVKTLNGLSVDARTADDIHALVVAVAAEQAAASRIATAATLDEVHQVINLWPSSNAADVVRLDLGLPPTSVRSAVPSAPG